MAQAYEETKGSLADRLMAALVAGNCTSGGHGGRLAAGMRVCKKGIEGYWLDLHVDKSDDAVVELHKKYVESDHAARGALGKAGTSIPVRTGPPETAEMKQLACDCFEGIAQRRTGPRSNVT